MGRKKLQAKKAKAKERAKAEKKHKQRLFAQREKRAERAKERLEREHRERQQPISNKTNLEKIETALTHNLEMLKALEEEYIADQKTRADVHEQLESEGYSSIEEKMEALKQKSAELVEKVQNEVEKEELPEEIASEIMPIAAKKSQHKKTG